VGTTSDARIERRARARRSLKGTRTVDRSALARARSARPTRRWGTFPTTADVGLWASGPTAEALLEGLGLALYGLLADPRSVRPREERVVRASGRDPAELAVAFLNALLVLEETDGFLGRRVAATTHGRPPTEVTARVLGEPFDPERHTGRTEVKAVTYHGLVFDPRAGRARVIVDL
jgi:SHS2 domain-containing protein